MTEFWPQYAVAALYAINLLLAANRHRRTKTETPNFWINLLANGIILTLLYFGNFWKGAF